MPQRDSHHRCAENQGRAVARVRRSPQAGGVVQAHPRPQKTQRDNRRKKTVAEAARTRMVCGAGSAYVQGLWLRYRVTYKACGQGIGTGSAHPHSRWLRFRVPTGSVAEAPHTYRVCGEALLHALQPPVFWRARTCAFVPPPAAGDWKRFPQRGAVAKPLITHFADAPSTAAPENRGEARDALTPWTTDAHIARSPALEKTPYVRAGSLGPTATPHTPTQHWCFPFVPRRVRGRQHRTPSTTRRPSFKTP
jgi:hypothetical protein